MVTKIEEKGWKDRISDYILMRNINNGSIPSEDIVDLEDIRRKKRKNQIIGDAIENSPEAGILSLIYRYSPPPTPTPAVNILCQRIYVLVKRLSAATFEELEEYQFRSSERMADGLIPVSDPVATIVQPPVQIIRDDD